MKETSRFYSALGLLIVLNAFVKPVWIFGIDLQVQNEVGVEAYGVYFSIFNLSIVLSFLNDWGLSVFYNRHLAAKDATLSGNPGSLLYLKFLFGLSYIAILFLIAFVSGIKRWEIILEVALVQILTSAFIFFRAIFTAQQWFQTDAWFSVLDKLLMIVACIPLLYFPSLFGGISVERFLLLQIGCTTLTLLLALVVLLTRKFSFSFKKLWPGKYILKAAIPFAIIALLMSCHSRMDGFLLERMSNATEAGKYAGAYRLLDAANMMGYLFATFLLPYIARNQKEGLSPTNLILSIRHLLLVFSITITGIVIFLAPWIQRVLYHHSDSSYVEVLQWCLPSLI